MEAVPSRTEVQVFYSDYGNVSTRCLILGVLFGQLYENQEIKKNIHGIFCLYDQPDTY